MKKIGIIFALKEELEETKNKFQKPIEHSIYELTIYECKNQNVVCYLVESGMGKVNAARSAQILIDKMEVDLLLNVGVAGSISENLNKCDIVIAEKLVQHDYNAIQLNFERGYIPNVGKYINCDIHLIELAKQIQMNTKVVTGVISSGDIFVTDKKMGEKIHNNFDALCVEMEGAAVAQVCALCKIPFLVVRAISDSPYEKDNQITFEEFLTISSNMVSKFVLEFLKKIGE